jgi:hypothetical protein
VVEADVRKFSDAKHSYLEEVLNEFKYLGFI